MVINILLIISALVVLIFLLIKLKYNYFENRKLYKQIDNLKISFSKTNNKPPFISYSQLGEDLIIKFIFNGLGFESIKYLDIGAHHPQDNNNTYLFYLDGSNGVLIEPDYYFIPQLEELRPKDTILNIGIGSKNKRSADFYVFDAKGLNTFDQKTAIEIDNEGDYSIKEIQKIKLMTIDSIIKKYFNGTPDFINIDTEGYEMRILNSINFDECRPPVFCIETLTFGERGMQKKNTDINKFMVEKGYFEFADTHVNTIFVDRELWINRKVPWLD